MAKPGSSLCREMSLVILGALVMLNNTALRDKTSLRVLGDGVRRFSIERMTDEYLELIGAVRNQPTPRRSERICASALGRRQDYRPRVVVRP